MSAQNGDDEYNLDSSLMLVGFVLLGAALGLGFAIGISCGFIVWNY
jgi:hypothetical protein